MIDTEKLCNRVFDLENMLDAKSQSPLTMEETAALAYRIKNLEDTLCSINALREASTEKLNQIKNKIEKIQ